MRPREDELVVGITLAKRIFHGAAQQLVEVDRGRQSPWMRLVGRRVASFARHLSAPPGKLERLVRPLQLNEGTFSGTRRSTIGFGKGVVRHRSRQHCSDQRMMEAGMSGKGSGGGGDKGAGRPANAPSIKGILPAEVGATACLRSEACSRERTGHSAPQNRIHVCVLL